MAGVRGGAGVGVGVATSTASAPSTGATPAATPAADNASRPLNVRDALTYLDTVKQTFAQSPTVYADFLDTMKDFKTGRVDTPGVIDRVSQLFRGHSELIQGFNTFLPPGYRVDCSFDPAENGLITVTTPNGVTRRDRNGVLQPSSTTTTTTTSTTAPPVASAVPSTTSSSTTPLPPSQPARASLITSTRQTPTQTPVVSRSTIPSQQPPARPPPSQPSTSSSSTAAASQAQAAAANAAASALSGPDTSANASGAAAAAALGVENRSGRPPAEFNHAINFVNKIKNRFHKRPDIYKTFLEILQTYQKEQKPIQEVYSQVTLLFRDAPDLLDEFKEFLPDTSASPASVAATVPAPLAPASTSTNTTTTASTVAPPPSTAATVPSQPAAPTRTVGTGRNQSTTSLFGVNPSGTSQPQPSQAGNYLGGGGTNDRNGQLPPGRTTLDAAASRRSAASGIQSGPYERGDQQIHGEPYEDASWQAQHALQQQQEQQQHASTTSSSTGAKKRRQATGSTATGSERIAVQEKGRQAKKGKHSHVPSESPDELLPPVGVGGYGAPHRAGYPGYPAGPLQPGISSASQGITYPPGSSNSSALLPPVQPIILPHALRPHGPRNQVQPLVNQDELMLFDRIRKYIDDKSTYQEFLKLLNLYTQEIIDMPTLLEKAFLFIGSSDEIFGLFREFVGEQDGFVEGEEWPIDNAPALERERFELFSLKSYGPSYRKLPYTESKGLACSGRDALCWSVLNDDWVAYATWASEGSGAHRKNPYEDALASSEQERHWYDYNIESNTRSIALLEPIVARISLMSTDERAAFKLKPGLGGASTSFYERIIRKIYGKDNGSEAIQALYDQPSIAVPIILNRMKQKDEEWKRALREWNRIWREVDAKNFYRSLDHQGLSFKANDKKTTTSKFLVHEIENLRKESKQKRISLKTPPSSHHQSINADKDLFIPIGYFNDVNSIPKRPHHQFEMDIDDLSVLYDVLRLAFSYLDRATTPYTSNERGRIETSLRKLIPLIFNLEEKEVEANLSPVNVFVEDHDAVTTGVVNGNGEEAYESDDESESMASASDDNSSSAVHSNGKKKKGKDLRKKVLASNSNGKNARGTMPNTASDEDGGLETDAQAASDIDSQLKTTSKRLLEEGTWISASSQPWPRSTSINASQANSNGPRQRSKRKVTPVQSPSSKHDSNSNNQSSQRTSKLSEPRNNFFASQSYYCMIRLIHMLYHRLATLKQLAVELSESPKTRYRLSPFAIDLGLAVPVNGIDDMTVPRGKNFYDFMLELCERWFEGEVDPTTFEEQLRYMWGTKAFQAFTIDKLLASMLKHVHNTNQDARAQQLLALLKQDRESNNKSVKRQMIYRHACEDVIGIDENLYRIEWISEAKTLTIQVLTADDPTYEDFHESESSWAYYVNSYVLEQPTEGLQSEVLGPFLGRNRVLVQDAAPKATDSRDDLTIRLGQDDMKISFVAGTEDTIFRPISEENGESDQEVRAYRNRAWKEWLASRQEQEVEDQLMQTDQQEQGTSKGDEQEDVGDTSMHAAAAVGEPATKPSHDGMDVE